MYFQDTALDSRVSVACVTRYFAAPPSISTRVGLHTDSPRIVFRPQSAACAVLHAHPVLYVQGSLLLARLSLLTMVLLAPNKATG